MTAKSIADILDAAADLITPEGAWAKDDWALNAAGRPVHPSNPEATCFCAVGALNRAMDIGTDERASDHSLFQAVRDSFAKVAGVWPLAFNSAIGRTQAEVVAAFRAAATLARTSTPGEA